MSKKKELIRKIEAFERISVEEALFIYNTFNISELIYLANKIREKFHKKNVYFIENIHIEPTNICVNNCRFCAFRAKNEEEAWNFSLDEIITFLSSIPETIEEVHITGGMHPSKNLKWYLTLFKNIKDKFPHAQIKALTAIEINYLSEIEQKPVEYILELLLEAGVTTIAGGGAEILDDEIRNILCPEKGSKYIWINTHKAAHKIGLKSNATMLYGHIENYYHRIKHLETIRNIQDETHGFLCFIPLKYRNKNNCLQDKKEVNLIEDVKLFAISRIFLDNVEHIKAYWPMFGLERAILCLHSGADDIDGTIYNTTKIFSKAGSEVLKPCIYLSELIELLRNEGFVPVKRNSLFNIIN
ncbi:MAG: CofH family radical SAM protein [Bacteroidales bacterium]|nr:CofH family radical SAM protein [Bacteroidales bacterium]